MTIPFEKSFSELFKDPKWVSKLLISALFSFLSLFLIGIPFLNGYIVSIVRKRLNGEEGLPEWTDFGQLFVDGIKLIAISLIYSLPIMVLSMGSALFSILGGQSDAASLLVLVFILPIQLLIFAYTLAMMLFQPLMYYTVAAGLPFSHAFQWKSYFETIKKDWTNALLAILFVWLASMLAVFGIFAFFIGVFATFAYSMAVMGDIYGRLLHEWKSQGRLA